MELRLELAYRLAPLRQGQNRLVLLPAVRFQQFPQFASRLRVVGVGEAKTFRRRNILLLADCSLDAGRFHSRRDEYR